MKEMKPLEALDRLITKPYGWVENVCEDDDIKTVKQALERLGKIDSIDWGKFDEALFSIIVQVEPNTEHFDEIQAKFNYVNAILDTIKR